MAKVYYNEPQTYSLQETPFVRDIADNPDGSQTVTFPRLWPRSRRRAWRRARDRRLFSILFLLGSPSGPSDCGHHRDLAQHIWSDGSATSPDVFAASAPLMASPAKREASALD